MNFYKRHIGDYIKDAGHLSLLEHGVYARLMDVYYTREEGIPEDKAARLIGARSKDELQALQNVLSEFFTLESETWIQGRCEREIDAANAKGDKNRENGKKGGRPRKTKTQQESETQTEENPNGFDVGSENNLSQTPDTRLQTPDSRQDLTTPSETSTVVGAAESGGTGCSPGQISKAMRSVGVMSQPADPRIIALSEQGVSLETVKAACAEAKRSKPDESIGPAYVIAIVERWAKEAAAINAKGARAPGQPQDRKAVNDEAKRLLFGNHQPTEAIDV